MSAGPRSGMNASGKGSGESLLLKSMNRVLRWDGIVVQKYKGEPGKKADPDDIKAIREFVEKHRHSSKPKTWRRGHQIQGRTKLIFVFLLHRRCREMLCGIKSTP